MTSSRQQAAEINFKPADKKLKGQKYNILVYIDTNGSITPMDAISDKRIHSTKLSTRIGEIERKCGLAFKHERESNGDSSYMRYSFADGHGVFDYLPGC